MKTFLQGVSLLCRAMGRVKLLRAKKIAAGSAESELPAAIFCYFQVENGEYFATKKHLETTTT